MKAMRLTPAAVAAVMSLSAMATLSGCGKTESGKDGKKSEDGKVVLEVLTNRTDRVDDGSLDKLTDTFEKENDCVVEYVGYKDYSGDVATRMGTEDYGDVLMIPDEVELSDLSNFFEPIGTYDELKDTYRWANKKMDSSKNVYGLAYGGTATGILYNKAVWSAAGITRLPA